MVAKPKYIGQLSWSRAQKRFYVWDGTKLLPLDDNGSQVMNEKDNKPQQQKPYVLEILATSFTTIICVGLVVVSFKVVAFRAINELFDINNSTPIIHTDK